MADKKDNLESMSVEELQNEILKNPDNYSTEELELAAGVPRPPRYAEPNKIDLQGVTLGDVDSQIAEGINPQQEIVPLGEFAAGILKNPRTSQGVRNVAELGLLGLGAETGILAGGNSVVGRVLGGMGGTAIADVGTDLLAGRNVDVDPLNTALGGLAPAFPAILKAARHPVETLRRGGAAIIESLDDLKNLTKAIGGSNSAFHVSPFGGTIDDTIAGAVNRLNDRGILKVNPDQKGFLGGVFNRAKRVSAMRENVDKEIARLGGRSAGNQGLETTEQIAQDGVLWKNLKQLEKELGDDATVPLEAISKQLDDIAKTHTTDIQAGASDNPVVQFFRNEKKKLLHLGLNDSKFARYKAADDTVSRMEARIQGTKNENLERLSISDQMDALGVRANQEGRTLIDEGATLESLPHEFLLNTDTWDRYQLALKDASDLTKEAFKTNVPLNKVYAKRISIDKHSRFDNAAAPIQQQLYTEYGSRLRGFIDEVAQKGDATGQEFLKHKEELSDLLATRPFFAQAEAMALGDTSSPFRFSILAPGKGSAAYTTLAVSKSRPFRFFKKDIADNLRRVAGGVDNATAFVAEKSKVHFPQATEKFKRITGKAGALIPDVGSMIQNRRGLKEFVGRAVVDAGMFELLGGDPAKADDYVEFSPEERQQLAQILPDLEQQVAQREAEFEQAFQAVDDALALGGEPEVGAAVSRLAKLFPEAFESPKSGIVGEVRINGKPTLLDPVDRGRYAQKIENMNLDSIEEYRVLTALHKDGTVIVPKERK